MWTRIPHRLQSTCQPLLRPHFELEHVTPRSALLFKLRRTFVEALKFFGIQRQGVGFGSHFVLCGAPVTPSITPLETVNATFFNSAVAIFVSCALIGPLEYKAACDWLRVSCWPKVDSQRVGNAGSEKFQQLKQHHAPPRSGAGVITGKLFLLKLH